MKNKKKILFIAPASNLIAPATGTDNRLHNLAMQLSKKNEVVILLPQKYINESMHHLPFKIYGFKILTSPFSADLNIDFFLTLLRVLKNEQIDAIQVAFPQGIQVLRFVCKILGLDLPTVYDAQKVEGDAVREFANPNISIFKRILAPRYLPLLERLAVKSVDHVISVSNGDKSRFIEKYNINSSKISVIPSGVNMRELSLLSNNNDIEKKLGVESKIKVVFHGLYSYFPNKEAVDLIVDYIAPEIYKKHKNLVFLLAGKDMPVFEKENVKSVGFVDNIYSFLNIADIAIVPLLHGGGTKLKIFDYMAVGLPIVTTKKGIEGIEAENDEHAIIVGDVNEEFIDAIKYLITNEQERKRLARNARKLAEEKYNWEKIGKKLNTLYFDLIRERKEGKKGA